MMTGIFSPKKVVRRNFHFSEFTRACLTAQPAGGSQIDILHDVLVAPLCQYQRKYAEHGADSWGSHFLVVLLEKIRTIEG